MTSTEEFSLPTCIEDAESRRAQLTRDVQEIQAQLGDKQRTDSDGRRLTSAQYWDWKKRAQHRLNQKLAELRAIKQWIRDYRRLSAPPLEPATVDQNLGEHLGRLVIILDRLKEEDVDFDREETIQIEAARACLRRLGASPNLA